MPTYKEKLGLMHVYTGDGKGKTTTSIGIALRAVGQNLKTIIIQYMKGGAYTGELLSIANYIPQLIIEQYGKPCVKEKAQLKLDGFEGTPKVEYYREDVECGPCRYCFLADEEEKRLVLDAFKRTKEVLESGEFNVVILDEINTALQKNLIPVAEVIKILESRVKKVEVVLTGRGAPKEIIDIADLASEIRPLKHYFDKGIMARKGIEY